MELLKEKVQIWQYFYSIYSMIMFTLIMLVAVPFVFMSLAFGSVKGGNLIYKVAKVWGKVWYFFIGVKHQNIYEAEHDKTRQYIFVANHISYMDIPPIVLTLNQSYRVLGKYEMVSYPVFGWIYKACVILVDRRNATQRAKSVRALKSALQKGISIFIFPEGTFNETEKPLKEFYDGAFKLAIDTQTSIKPLLFLDTKKRLHFSSLFALTPGKSRVLYLAEINTTNHTVQTLKAAVYKAMEKGLIAYSV